MESLFKLATAALWSSFTFGLAYLFNEVFKEKESLDLFIVVAVCVSVGYDGLKSIFTFTPSDKSEIKEMFIGAISTIVYLIFAVGAFGTGPVLVIKLGCNETISQLISFGGLVFFYALAIQVASGTEKRMKSTNGNH